MSVESEILRIQHNIANTYTAVAEKGGEVPLQPNSANLAAAVASIPAGGALPAGGSTGQVLAKASDADGDVAWVDQTGGIVEWDQIDGRPDLSAVANLNVKILTLQTDFWEDNAQTITVDGILADETAQLIVPLPQSASEAAYNNAGVRCAAQGDGTLTFVCNTTPASDLVVNVFVIGAVSVDTIPIYFEWWSPHMTGDNTPAPYAVTCGGYDSRPSNGGGEPWKMWDGDTSTGWLKQGDRSILWNAIDLGSEMYIKGVAMYPNQVYQYPPESFNLDVSADGVFWNTVKIVSGFTGAAEYQRVIFDDYFKTRYLRISNVQESPNINGFAGINEIELYVWRGM